MDSRFSKPVMPGRHPDRAHVGRRPGRALYQTVTQEGTVVIDGGVFTRDAGVEHRDPTTQCECGGADQGAVGPEGAGDDARAAGEVEPAARRRARPCAAAKNGSPKPSATEPADDRERQVEQVRDRRDRAADERARSARRTSSGRVGRRRAGDARDRRARRLGLEAAARAAPAHVSVGLDDHVADVAGVARRAPSSSRPSSTMPPPTPVDTTIPM